MVQDRSYDYEMSEYKRDLAAIGDDGVIMQEIPENPIKMLHWLMGPENAMLATMDFPEKIAELAEIHTAKTVEFVNGLCERTCYEDAPILLSNDNLDSFLFPPMYLMTIFIAIIKRWPTPCMPTVVCFACIPVAIIGTYAMRLKNQRLT